LSVEFINYLGSYLCVSIRMTNATFPVSVDY